MKRTARLVSHVATLTLVFAALFSSAHTSRIRNEKPQVPNDLHVNIVPATYIRHEEEEHHIYLDREEPITYSAPNPSDGFKFTSTQIILNAANRSFLADIKLDLYIQSHDYWNGNLGAWTPNSTFTLANPITEEQELFLKIIHRYSRRAYALDTINGTEHAITFQTDAAADRVMMNWGFFAVLKSLEVNGSHVDVSSALSFNQLPIMLEYLSYRGSFHLPHPRRIQNTMFSLKLEETDLPPPPQSPHIAAILIQQRVVTLNPAEEYLFQVPEVTGWSYSYGIFYSNLTLSMYPTPYPFHLINLALWNPEETPVSATPVDTTFGIRNLSNQTYHVSVETALYYWQNTTGIIQSHQANTTENSIYHTICVNISDASIGTKSGLRAQYLTFGSTGKTLSYEAPDPVGKFEDSYIPLREGSYTLTTVEPRIVSDITANVDDLHLSATLTFSVTYDGDPYANAEITVLQRRTPTNATYKTCTDVNGQANITIRVDEIGMHELDIIIEKDTFNYTKQTINVAVGIPWIVAAVFAVGTIALSLLYFKRLRKRSRNLNRQQEQPQKRRPEAP